MEIKVNNNMKATAACNQGIKKLEKAAKDFEAVLMSQFFRLMHATVGDEGVIDRSFSRKIYEEMIQDEFAGAFCEQGGFGLQKVLVEKFRNSVASGNSGAENNRDNGEYKKLRITGIPGRAGDESEDY